jgi:hypothetical protein
MSDTVPKFDVELPMPPSLNGAYANMPGVGRVKVTSYRKWQDVAVAMIRVSIPAAKRIAGTVNVHILLRSRCGATVTTGSSRYWTPSLRAAG